MFESTLAERQSAVKQSARLRKRLAQAREAGYFPVLNPRNWSSRALAAWRDECEREGRPAAFYAPNGYPAPWLRLEYDHLGTIAHGHFAGVTAIVRGFDGCDDAHVTFRGTNVDFPPEGQPSVADQACVAVLSKGLPQALPRLLAILNDLMLDLTR